MPATTISASCISVCFVHPLILEPSCNKLNLRFYRHQKQPDDIEGSCLFLCNPSALPDRDRLPFQHDTYFSDPGTELCRKQEQFYIRKMHLPGYEAEHFQGVLPAVYPGKHQLCLHMLLPNLYCAPPTRSRPIRTWLLPSPTASPDHQN